MLTASKQLTFLARVWMVLLFHFSFKQLNINICECMKRKESIITYDGHKHDNLKLQSDSHILVDRFS